MKLRIAKKIWKSIGTAREGVYTSRQKDQAYRRIQRTQDSKDLTAFWVALIEGLGPLGRAQITARHDPARALTILMSYPESKWEGNPRALDPWLKRK
ncbi:MAG: hypothetical protein KGL39_00965 [Patescibacteria group bacterium]|nr:hypothetical protein [Patescibacteria group bacterium]